MHSIYYGFNNYVHVITEDLKSVLDNFNVFENIVLVSTYHATFQFCIYKVT